MSTSNVTLSLEMGAGTIGDQSHLRARGRQDDYSSSATQAVAANLGAEVRALTNTVDHNSQSHKCMNCRQHRRVGDGRVGGCLDGLDDRSDLNGCI
jgi:hypothetical protein